MHIATEPRASLIKLHRWVAPPSEPHLPLSARDAQTRPATPDDNNSLLQIATAPAHTSVDMPLHHRGGYCPPDVVTDRPCRCPRRIVLCRARRFRAEADPQRLCAGSISPLRV